MKQSSASILILLGWILNIGNGFSPRVAKVLRGGFPGVGRLGIDGGRQSLSSIVAKSSEDESNEEITIPTADVVKKVAVTGATGKTGKLVVDELLNRNVQVVGLVRNETKAAELFGDYSTDMLEIQECNLADPEAIAAALDGCNATIWCATGFSDDATSQTPPTVPMPPERSIDVMGVPAVATTLLQNYPETKASGFRGRWRRWRSQRKDEAYPKVVMLSR
jgi:hypothetical protein